MLEKDKNAFQEMIPVVMEAMLASSTDLSFVKDKSLTYVCASRAFAQMAGFQDEKMIVGKTDYDLFEPALAKKFREDDLKLIEGGKSLIDYIEKLPPEDGISHYSCTSKYLLKDANGEMIGLYGVGRDVTEDKEAYRRLSILEQENRKRYEHELRLRQELIKSSILYYQLNLTTNVVEEYVTQLNDTPGMAKGVHSDEALRKTILGKIAPEDRDKMRAMVISEGIREAYIHGQASRQCIYRRIMPDGYYHWIRTHVSVLEKPDTGDLIAFIQSQDIDRERKSQLAVETIMNEDIEVVLLLDLSTRCATVAHMRNYDKDTDVMPEFDFDDACKRFIIPFVLEEDRNAIEDFFHTEHLQKALDQEEYDKITYQVKDKEKLRRKIIKAYYLDQSKREIVITCRDITELYEDEQRQKQELKAAVDAANEANHAKSDFLSHMSHDIRTPLNAVLAFSGKELAEKADENTLRDYMKKINVSGEYLLGIINDVLDMSRIEQNKIVLDRQPYYEYEFEGIIRNVIGELSKDKGVTFEIDKSSMKREGIMVDHVRFNQIFINLLSNAVKFTPCGGRVELIIEEIERPDPHRAVKRFIVRDNGIGMSQEFMPHAFESFNQEYRKDHSERVQGTGLGLSIVQKLVKMMGGTIQLESEINKGTVFTVDLPVDLVEQEKDRGEVRKTDFSDLKGVRILLVEDNKVNIEIAIRLLESQGCILECAEDGLEACERFENAEPWYYQLILMDIRMPVMNGLEATRRIRSMRREDAKRIPIIAMTADAFSEDEQGARAAGMNAHLAKPVDPELLYEVCSQYVRESRRAQDEMQTAADGDS